MEPNPGYHTEVPQTVLDGKNPESDESADTNLKSLGQEIDEGVTELANGVGQTALWIASRFATFFGVNPDNPKEPDDESPEPQVSPLP